MDKHMPKRIINGQTYNTDTATLIARAEANFGDNPNLTRPGEHAEMKVYQTRGGAFFLHTFSQTPRKDVNGNWQLVEDNKFEPMTREEVEQWVESAGYLDYQIELLSPTIGEPPEAAGEAVPAASLYIRVPTSLKVRIEEAAEADKLSVNAWAMRCMETCIARNKTMGE
jgi:predicted HicB family RNase H-like nuclease